MARSGPAQPARSSDGASCAIAICTRTAGARKSGPANNFGPACPPSYSTTLAPSGSTRPMKTSSVDRDETHNAAHALWRARRVLGCLLAYSRVRGGSCTNSGTRRRTWADYYPSKDFRVASIAQLNSLPCRSATSRRTDPLNSNTGKGFHDFYVHVPDAPAAPARAGNHDASSPPPSVGREQGAARSPDRLGV